MKFRGLVLMLLIFSTCHCRERVLIEPELPLNTEKVWDLREKMVDLAGSLVGLPYKYGGTEINGFDCSGLIYYVYDAFGYKIARSAKLQSMMKKRIDLETAQPADILVFKLRRGWHTAIYTGNNVFIHAPHRRSCIRKEPLDDYWKKSLRYVIRIINE